MFIKKINTIIVLAVVYTLSAGFSPPAPAGLDEIRLDILERLATKGGYEGFAARMVLAAATGDTTGLGSANLAFRAVDNRQLTESPDGYYWKWHFDIALYYLFRDSPSILYPKTRAAMEERLWLIANLPGEGSAVGRAITGDDPQNVRVTMYTENHTLWRASIYLLLAQLFEGRTYEDGRKGSDHLRFWEQWLSNYLDYRAGRLFWEAGSSVYENVILVCLFDLNSFAHSALLRKKAGMLADLILAAGAMESLDGTRAGGRARQYSAFTSRGHWAVNSRLFLELGELSGIIPPHTFNKVISAYRPPPVVIRLAQDRKDLGTFVVKSRRPHSIDPGAGSRCRKYSYISPQFILGGFQMFGYGRFTSFPENKWAGLIMRGHPDARIVPYFHPRTGRDYSYHEYFQHENVLIARLPDPARIYFADALEEVAERGGWIFARMGRAYAAARPAAGSYQWEESDKAPGRFASLTRSGTPIIIEADTCADGFNAFQDRILGRSLRFEHNLLKYENRRGQVLQYCYGESPRLDGKPVEQEVKSYPLFDSPYLKSAWGSGYVHLEVGDQGLVLDFRDRNQPERIVWQGKKNRMPEPSDVPVISDRESERPPVSPKEPGEILFMADFEDGRLSGWGKNVKLIKGGCENSRFAIIPLNPYDRIPVEIFFQNRENQVPIGPETRIRFNIRTSRTGIVALFGWSKATSNNFQTDYFYFPGSEWRRFDIRVRDYFPKQAGERLANINFQVVPYSSGEVRIDNIIIYNPSQ